MYILAAVILYFISVAYLIYRLSTSLRPDRHWGDRILFIVPLLNTLIMLFSIGIDIMDWYYGPRK